MNKLPKDICGLLFEYIQATPNDWDLFREAFDNANVVMQAKRKELLSKSVWIELEVNLKTCAVLANHVYDTKPVIDTKPYLNFGYNYAKLVLIEQTMGDFISCVRKTYKIHKPKTYKPRKNTQNQ